MRYGTSGPCELGKYLIPHSRCPTESDSITDDELTLADVRKLAHEKLKGTCGVYKVCDGGPARLCQGQKFGASIGFGGAGKGLAFQANVDSLDAIRLRTRLLTEHVEPDLSIELFGRELSMPVLASSLSGVKACMANCEPEIEFATGILQGSLDAGTIGLIGNTSDEDQELCGVNALKYVDTGIPIFKPQENSRLIELIGMAEEAGAIAVGVDVDGCGSTNWERMGKPVFRKSVQDIRELVDSTGLPFMVKGIMSVEDALDAVSTGAAAIDVSNHGGRVLDSTPGVAEVLPEIAKEVDGQVIVTAGGGVRTGFDVLKMLALGADAVMLGRDIARASIGADADGVRLHFEYIASDLRRAMLLTSCNSVGDIGPQVIVQS